jgi:hypothetical protein
MINKTTTVGDWLMDARQLQPGDQLNIYLWAEKVPSPSLLDMRAALYAQYGSDTLIRIWKHGQRICIFVHADEDSRQRFDERNAPRVYKIGGKRIEIENGFETTLADALDAGDPT